MGAASSTVEGASADPSLPTGIVTVNAAQPRPGAPQDDPLLRHLAALRARVPELHASIDANDPENVWRDLEAAKALGSDTQQLNSAVADILTAYQAWHNENSQAIIANQAYVHRSIDQAEIKARKAVQHVRLQTQRLKALQAQMDAVKGLPAALSAVCTQTAELQAALQGLEARAAASGSAEGAQSGTATLQQGSGPAAGEQGSGSGS